MTRKPVAFRLTSDGKSAHAPKPAAKTGRKPKNPSQKPKPATKSRPRKPKALPIDDIVLEPEDFEQAVPSIRTPQAQSVARTMRWGAMFATAFTGLISIWASVTFINLIEGLFARSQLLGWIGTGLLAIAGLAAFAIAVRELIGIFSLRKISKIRQRAETATNMKDKKAGDEVFAALIDLYQERPDLAWGMAELKQADTEFTDPDEQLSLLETNLMATLDEQAGQIIASASRRVTVLTAIAPTIILDMVFVAAQNMKMLRQLTSLYGGRPGTLGTVKLSSMVVSHLAVTGGLALSDTLIQQFVGRGLLGRLSARFGEGAFNGILTARIGLAALDLTRPIPFSEKTRPSLTDFLKNIISFQSADDNNLK